MAKVKRIIRMQSTAGTGYSKTTKKNSKNVPAKMKLKMYDPVIRKHVLFEEKKA